MPPRSKKKKEPAWFNQAVSENDKGLFKRALARYIATEFDQKDSLPHANVETYLAVLPYTQELIPKWRKVNRENFSTHNLEAHKAYQNTLRNLIHGKT